MALTPDYVPTLEEEFILVYEAIYRNTTSYMMDEVPEIVAKMREARQVLDMVIHRAGLDVGLPPYEDALDP